MKIHYTARVTNQQWRHDPETGFLRCTVAVLRVDVLRYLPEEMPGAPTVGGDGMVWLYVPPVELADPGSIASLEGMPATVGHIWQDVGTVGASCGNIAGAPAYDADTLFADVLVTDPEAVRRIMLPAGDTNRLEEISSAYDAQIEWIPGIDKDGNPYHGFFKQIRYNHIALLPRGMGRAGSSVRIINRHKGVEMEFTRMKLRSGQYARVANEDVPAVEDDQKQSDTQAKNAIDPAKLQEAMDQLADVNAQMAALQASKSELEGQLQALQEQLTAALSPDTVEGAAQAMNEERDDADKVMNSHGLTLTPEQRKLRGHALRLEVVNSVRVKNAAAVLDATADEPFVRGMFSTLREFPSVAIKQVAPAGHQIVQNTNGGAQQSTVDFSTNEGRRAALYGGKA